MSNDLNTYLEGMVSGSIGFSGGGGGSSDYEDLSNKPKINDVELSGNKTTSQLGISYTDISDKPSINNVTLAGNKSTSDLHISYDDLEDTPTIQSVVANPIGTPTDNLESLQVDNTIYGIGSNCEIINLSAGDGSNSRTFQLSKIPKFVALYWYELNNEEDWATYYSFIWGQSRTYGMGGNQDASTANQYTKVASITYDNENLRFTLSSTNPGSACNSSNPNHYGYMFIIY